MVKQSVGILPSNCLSVFDHFVGLPLKGLNSILLFTHEQSYWISHGRLWKRTQHRWSKLKFPFDKNEFTDDKNGNETPLSVDMISSAFL